MRKRFVLEIHEPETTEEYNDTEGECEKRNSIHSVSVIAAAFVVVGILALYGIVFAIDGILPTPLTIADEEKYPDAFIAERAQNDLKLLTAYGPRVVGSYENEVMAVELLKRQISVIKESAHPNQEIQTDIQLVSGSYLLGYKPTGAINAYSNVQNVVVRISSKNNSAYSLLVNAHFDSVPTSPGGSDDGINCAVMLEVLRKITKLPDRPEHNIVFLFNGAEETPLQASHGFITQHKWAKEVKVLINLEAAGHGGKAVLFQTSPGRSWLTKYYNKVPHPFGQASGEEIFQSNLIPSDTDFRIFRDFGGLIGYDFAFARNGYRYHTKYDDFEHLPLGSYQHVGDNTLSLVKSVSNAPELNHDTEEQQDKIVYYDFIGWFMISYTETVAIIINIITTVISVAVFIYSLWDFGFGITKHTFKYLVLVTAAIVIGWLFSAAFVLFFAFILDQVKYTMSWYGNPWILFGLYSAPIVACTTGSFIVLNWFTKKSSYCINIKTQVQLHMMRMIWSIILFIGTIMKIRSVYALLLPVMFQTLVFLIIYLARWQHTVRKWQILYLVGTIIPTMFLMYTTILMLSLFIPICGRIGSEKNPEIMVAIITLLMTVLVTSSYVPLISLVRQHLIFLVSMCFFFVFALIIVFTPLGFPYTGNSSSPAPQRFWVYHTRRTFNNDAGQLIKRDSGFFLINMDRNSPHSVKNYVPSIEQAKPLTKDCETYLLCGLPFASIKTMGMVDASTWIPAPQPEIIESPIGMTYSQQSVTPTLIRYDVSIKGPDRQSVFIASAKNTKLVKISLLDEVPDKAITWNDRDTYLIIHTYGKEAKPLTFTFDMEVPQNWNQTVADIAVVGQYSNQKKIRFTPEYTKFIKQFPDWADVTPWVGAYESWVLS